MTEPPDAERIAADILADAGLPVMRPTRVRKDDDGTLDDFCAWDVKMVHFEAMDQSQWYATVETNSGEIWQLRFGACNDRAKGYAFAENVEQFVRPVVSVPGRTNDVDV